MNLTDTHCHIQSADDPNAERHTHDIWAKNSDLTGDRILKNAAEHSVTRCICVGCDLEDSRLAVDFVASHSNCSASIGIHPHEADAYAANSQKQADFADLLMIPQAKIVAIGECGLDYFYDHAEHDAQQRLLRYQIELALEHNLPMIFHVREALPDFWKILDSYPPIRGVLHSFTDSSEHLANALARGLYIGVNGIVTFTKDSRQLNVYREIPLQRLLLETDAPYLTPTPYRGTINEPKYVKVVAEYMAEMYHITVEQVAAATTTNALELFGE